MKHKLVKDINTQTLYKFVKNDNLTGRGVGSWMLEVGSLSFEVERHCRYGEQPLWGRYQHRHPGSCFLLRFARSRSDDLKPQTL